MPKPLEIVPAKKAEYVRTRTDKYFTKSREIVEKFGDKTVTYGVFLRRGVICAVNPAIECLREYYPADAAPLKITRAVRGRRVRPRPEADVHLHRLVRGAGRAGDPHPAAHRRRLRLGLQRLQDGDEPAEDAFIDMHARHSRGDDFSLLAAYGAAVGSRMAKLNGAIGFIGSSQDLTAHFYGLERGLGTMPHALVGYAGSTLRAAQMFVETHPQDNLTVLVDYYGREYTDALEVCRWWYNDVLPHDPNGTRTLSLRVDTHGDRFAEGLTYEKSVDVVTNWLHVLNEYEAVRMVMGEEAFDADTLNVVKDRVRRVLFGTGVSLASVIQLRQKLDAAGFNGAKVVASSGFNLFKCKMFGNARAPVDAIGTGSFIPDNYGDTFATADVFMYDGEFGIKVGREKLFQGLKP